MGNFKFNDMNNWSNKLKTKARFNLISSQVLLTQEALIKTVFMIRSNFFKHLLTSVMNKLLGILSTFHSKVNAFTTLF